MEVCDAIIINDKFYPMAENLDSLKELENKLTYIDQPLTSQLSSLLQILCKKSNNPKMIEYLLKQGANPYYMDIDGNTAYEYAIENIYHMKDWLFILLNQYSSRFKHPDTDSRNEFVFNFIKAEIIKHELEQREKEKTLLEVLDTLSIDEEV
ncbi:MAG: hypothetical protein IJZ30_02750 [Alphaproteobacteria bacterium]|nr:hypothetical protein [Alphaproteobacteria bacterium]